MSLASLARVPKVNPSKNPRSANEIVQHNTDTNRKMHVIAAVIRSCDIRIKYTCTTHGDQLTFTR